MHTLSGTAYFQTDNKWFNAGKYLLTAPGDTEANIAEPNTENVDGNSDDINNINSNIEE